MEHLSLEIFDLSGSGSKYANLPEDTSITITDTSEIFASGDVWSYSFTLNVFANAHIFGSSGDLHGARIHDQIDRRKARLWVDGLPMYFGYIRLSDETNIGTDGDVDINFESGQKTFDDMIEGTSAREVSVGDVVIGVALNRKRVVVTRKPCFKFRLTGLEPIFANTPSLKNLYNVSFDVSDLTETKRTPFTQRWPKFVKSHGRILHAEDEGYDDIDYTNIHSPYDSSHPFCNINICYQLKVNVDGEEKTARGYTVRLGYGNSTTDGSDNQTRYNNAPNFYLLHFIDRLFKDLKIHVAENQALDVEDLRRVFMLNFGCFYEELEDEPGYADSTSYKLPDDKLSRYGQFLFPLNVSSLSSMTVIEGFTPCVGYDAEGNNSKSPAGKVNIRNLKITQDGKEVMNGGSVEGGVDKAWTYGSEELSMNIVRNGIVGLKNALFSYMAYLAYATGENYPNVGINKIVDAMKSMFGVRFLFSREYNSVRIVLLRNIFRRKEVQDIQCEVTYNDKKVENSVRVFRMTYGQGTDDTSFYYKGFNDVLNANVSEVWADSTDKHDYSNWKLDAVFDIIKSQVSAMNKTCYVTPVNGNAYAVKVDEDEDVLFPSLFGVADFMDAEDGNRKSSEEDSGEVEEVSIDASPVIMNNVNGTYAVFFSGDMKAPHRFGVENMISSWFSSDNNTQKIATYARVTTESIDFNQNVGNINVSGQLDVFIREGYQIALADNYDISNGVTPFDDADPGLCFGIMRGSGADARIIYAGDDKENEGNYYWDVAQGSGAIDHHDTCDNYGNEWDYNGSEAEDDTGGRISLKLRAEKPNPYYVEGSTDPEKKDKYLTISNPKLRGRGLCDQFYKEYSYWVRNARIVKRTVRMELAQLLSIDKSVKVRVGDVTGFIRKMEFTVNNKSGLGNVTMEIMYI